MDQQSPVVVVTLREIWAQLVGVSAKVDVVLAQQSATTTDVNDHESRLRALERNRWPLASVTVLVGLAALVVSIVAMLRG